MSYATTADLINAIGQREAVQLDETGFVTEPMVALLAEAGDTSGLTADEAKALASLEKQLTDALADARSLIDAHLARRYALPIGDPPRILRRICVDLARYYLQDHDPKSTVVKRYEDWLAFLKRVAAGNASLDVPESAQPAPERGGVAVHAPQVVFTQETLRDYTDPD